MSDPTSPNGEPRPKPTDTPTEDSLSSAMLAIGLALDAGARLASIPSGARPSDSDFDLIRGGLRALAPALAYMLRLRAGKDMAALLAEERGAAGAFSIDDELRTVDMPDELTAYKGGSDLHARIMRAGWRVLLQELRLVLPEALLAGLESALHALEFGDIRGMLHPAANSRYGAQYERHLLSGVIAAEVEFLQAKHGGSQSASIARATGIVDERTKAERPSAVSIDLRGSQVTRRVLDKLIKDGREGWPEWIVAARRAGAWEATARMKGEQPSQDHNAFLDWREFERAKLNADFEDKAIGWKGTLAAAILRKSKSG